MRRPIEATPSTANTTTRGAATMANDKYEFTGETKVHLGVTLRQIRALRAFGLIAAGAIGGWIEKEGNLQVYGDARVYGNAQVYGAARVYGNARVYGDAQVSGNAQVYGNAWVYGDAWVSSPICAASRSDAYLFIITPDKDGVLRIIAGRRYFTIAEARAHWTATRGGTPLGDESLAIVDHLERMAAIRFAK